MTHNTDFPSLLFAKRPAKRSRRDPETLLPKPVECITLDIRALRREGKLTESGRFVINWGDERAPLAIVAIAYHDGEVATVLKRLPGPYGHLPAKAERIRVVVADTPHFLTGAFYVWFACPACNARVFKLYTHLRTHLGFRCRKCADVRSNRLSKHDLARQRLAKINAKLNCPTWRSASRVWKPYYMHREVFEALKAEKAALEAKGYSIP